MPRGKSIVHGIPRHKFQLLPLANMTPPSTAAPLLRPLRHLLTISLFALFMFIMALFELLQLRIFSANLMYSNSCSVRDLCRVSFELYAIFKLFYAIIYIYNNNVIKREQRGN